jgi:lysophospholipase L1-like esterase
VDTFDAAAVPVGLRLCVTFSGGELEVEFDCPGSGAGVAEAWVGDTRVAEATLNPGKQICGFELPPGPITIYLPVEPRPEPLRLRAGTSEIEPGAPGPRWIAYGDSITEGMVATRPALAWPAIVARRCGLDLLNLGFAGAGRGETAVAEQIGELAADFISLAFGTNCWSRTPTTPDQLAANARAFLLVVADAHPATPVVILSPILRPDAELAPNRFGATLVDLRAVIEEVARGAPGVTLVSGRELVTSDQLPDDVHPDDAGHLAIACAMEKAMREAGAGAPAQTRSAVAGRGSRVSP